MSALDGRIVRATQAGLPLVAEPFRALGTLLGVPQQVLLSRIGAMLADGRIRRIGAVPNHFSLGYAANAMSVWDVADAAIGELGPRVGALAFVSHCYRRPRRPGWRYNLFAMVHGRSRADTGRQVAEIGALLGDASHACDVLHSVRILKKTGLRFA